jgi:hypothetical protein
MRVEPRHVGQYMPGGETPGTQAVACTRP